MQRVPDWNPKIGETRITFEIRKDGKPFFILPILDVPTGGQLRECYETDTEFIICGWPREDDETHDCDALGCSTINHVLCRVQKHTANTTGQLPAGQKETHEEK